MIVGELDARWDITYRWSLVGFDGAGSTANEIGDFGEARAKWAGGAGIRQAIFTARISCLRRKNAPQRPPTGFIED